MENKMQMINVLKRLAELDAGNSNVDTTAMIATESLLTQSEVAESAQLDECGMGAMMPPAPHTPASINMTANSGEELTGMLKSLMTLAGVQQSAAPMHAPEANPAHGGELGGDHGMAKTISIIDSMNAEDEGAVEGMEDRVYDNSPEEEVGSVDPDQMVTIGKHEPQPARNLGDNPLKKVKEDVDPVQSVTQQLFKDYQAFKNGQ